MGPRHRGDSTDRSILAMLLAAGLHVAAVNAEFYGIVDGDGDGVDDNRDRCLYTSAHERVDANGCAVNADQDLDGIADHDDDCPYSPAGAQVDSRGCAVDEDFDGVANGLDACAGSQLGAIVDARGCTGGQLAKATPLKPKSAPAIAIAAAPPVPSPAPNPPRQIPAPLPPQAALPSLPPPEPAAPPVTSPESAAPLPVIAVNPSALFSVSFAAGSNRIGAGGLGKLQQALPAMRRALRARNAVLVVDGYADAETDGDMPDKVARSRANQLRRLLVDQGIDPTRIQSVGHAAREAGIELRRAEVTLEVD